MLLQLCNASTEFFIFLYNVSGTGKSNVVTIERGDCIVTNRQIGLVIREKFGYTHIQSLCYTLKILSLDRPFTDTAEQVYVAHVDFCS